MNATRLRCTTRPPFYPLTLEEAKLHLRVDGTEEDEQILSYIFAATEYVQTGSNRQLIQATYVYTLPSIEIEGARQRSWVPGYEWLLNAITLSGSRATIPLPKPPLVSVASVEYYDADDELQELDEASYRVLPDDTQPGLLVITDIPSMALREDALKITYVAGYGYQEDVPESLKVAIRMLIGEFYRRREASTDAAAAVLPIGVDRLIDSQAVRGF